jgi:hypothetical protein
VKLIHNLSQVLIRGLVLDLKVNQMLPEKEKLTLALNQFQDQNYGLKIINWDELASDYIEVNEIEPNEFQPIHFDFIIPSNVDSVSVNSRFTKLNGKKMSNGWSLTTIHNIKKENER